MESLDLSTEEGCLEMEYAYLNQTLEAVVTMNESKMVHHMPRLLRWLNKLVQPNYKYNINKRNRYMCLLAVNLMGDPNKIDQLFLQPPPSGELLDFDKIHFNSFLKPYEEDSFWQNERDNNQDVAPKKCVIRDHEAGTCPDDHGVTLDKQFALYLHIAQPYITKLQSNDRKLAKAWLHVLCCILDKNCTCAESKGIRNDYMMVFLGYVNDRSLGGPFETLPKKDQLMPICEFLESISVKPSFNDPNDPRFLKFINEVPAMDEGAFALIAISGDMYNE